MILRFTIPRKPCGVNAAYGKRNGPGKGLYLTPEGRDYKDAVKCYAMLAVRGSGWPAPKAVKRCAVDITTWNTKHDVDSASKFTIDSLQGVLFDNDRVVWKIAMKKDNDGGKPRVEVEVEI